MKKAQLLISKLICFCFKPAETQQFELVVKNELLELFPAQPQFYFLFGIRIQSAQAIKKKQRTF
jgi:hypothetical protein